MLMIFYRRFYILLFLIWLAATVGIFVLSVWGDFDKFVHDFREIVEVGTKPVDLNATDQDMAVRTADKLVHKVQVARDTVRQKVVDEVVSGAVAEVTAEVAKDVRAVEKVLGMKPAAPGVPMARVEARAETLLGQARQHAGAGELLSMAFSGEGDRITAHLTTSKPVDKVTAFWLPDPTRLVVDLRGEWKNLSPRISRFGEGFLYRVVIGMHSDRLRLVFKFSDAKAPLGERPGLIHTDQGLDIVVDDPAMR